MKHFFSIPAFFLLLPFCNVLLSQTCLTANYHFDSSYVDSTGNNPVALPNGGIVFSTDRNGIANSAILFDGIDDYVDLPFGVNNQFSIGFWIKPVSYNPDTVAGPNIISNVILSNLTNAVPNTNFEVALNYDDSTISMGAWSLPSYIETTTHFDTSSWRYLMITKDDSVVKMYVNGAMETQLDVFSTNITPSNLRIGARRNYSASPNDSVAAFFYNGYIDEFSVYDCALNDTQVFSVFSAFDTVPTLSVKESTNNPYSVFPNPSNSEINISGLQQYIEYEVKIYDNYGRLVYSSIGLSDDKPLLISHFLGTGVYFIRVSQQGKTNTLKFIRN